jgi:hypothetical protein
LPALCDQGNKKTAGDAVLFTYFYAIKGFFGINAAKTCV